MFAELQQASIDRIAYSFAGDHPARDVGASYRRALTAAIASWRSEHERSGLFWIAIDTELVILDLRSIASRPIVRLSGLSASLYAACDDIRALQALRASAPDEVIERQLAELVEQRLMLREGNSYLSLALSLARTPLHAGQRAHLLERVHDPSADDIRGRLLDVIG